MNSTLQQGPGATAAGSMNAMSPDLPDKVLLGARHCFPATAYPVRKDKGSSFANVAKESSLPMAFPSGSALKISSLKA